MKKYVFLAALAAMVMMACTRETGECGNMVTVDVRLGGFTISTEPMTTRSDLSDFCTRIDVWVTDGSEVTAVNQQSTGADFGSLSLTLDRTKSYTIYAVAHKATGEATLADGVISFPDDKVTHSFFVSREFAPTDGMTLELVMQRIVAQLRVETTDALPDEVKKMRITTSDVSHHRSRQSIHGSDSRCGGQLHRRRVVGQRCCCVLTMDGSIVHPLSYRPSNWYCMDCRYWQNMGSGYGCKRLNAYRLDDFRDRCGGRYHTPRQRKQ